MSFETRNQNAAKVFARWQKANSSPAAQERLIDDRERLWRLARDLADSLDNLLADAHTAGRD